MQAVNTHEYTSIKSLNDNEQKNGFWGVLARKAKSMLDENGNPQKDDELPQPVDDSTQVWFYEFQKYYNLCWTSVWASMSKFAITKIVTNGD